MISMIKGPITYSFEELVAFKVGGLADEKALGALRAEADQILDEKLLRVTDKTVRAPSGNPHDYATRGRYWWPNPDTPDGLPWINRDGYSNPDSTDGITPALLFSRIKKLALAAFYFEDKARIYADYAMRQLYEWYINPETKMTPHAKYAQGIPGICEGRCTGLIDFSSVFVLFDAIGIFDCLGLVLPDVICGVKEWYNVFTDWMLTHEYGLGESNDFDNHGSWYDAQILCSAVFCNRPQLARKICKTAYSYRVKRMILPDGSQPSELRRTQAFNYSFYNLEALRVIAAVAERLGYNEYWGIDSERGVCILKSAVDFLTAPSQNPSDFPYTEFHPERLPQSLAKSMRSVGKRYDGYTEMADAICKAKLIEPSI